MMKRRLRSLLCLLLALCCLLALTSCALFGEPETEPDGGKKPAPQQGKPEPTVTDGDLQIHFLELGNRYTGDCTYIKAGDKDILIDAGSRTTSVSTIQNYINQYVTDNKLEYVIVTHAHQDHYAGFTLKNGSLFDLYEVDVIIDFALTNQVSTGASMYDKYLAERDAEIAAGATHYTAAECITEGKSVFALTDEISLTVLDSAYYFEKSSDENNYSVCTMLTYGENRYLFTGDLEKEGEEALVERNELPNVTLYKAGHHGSKTSSTATLLEKISPEIVCVCCCAGSPEYTKTNENQFPTQSMIDRIAPYTDRVYVTTLCVDYEKGEYTSLNGNITVTANKTDVSVSCSASDLRLKFTDWFKQNRQMPAAWA